MVGLDVSAAMLAVGRSLPVVEGAPIEWLADLTSVGSAQWRHSAEIGAASLLPGSKDREGLVRVEDVRLDPVQYVGFVAQLGHGAGQADPVQELLQP